MAGGDPAGISPAAGLLVRLKLKWALGAGSSIGDEPESLCGVLVRGRRGGIPVRGLSG